MKTQELTADRVLIAKLDIDANPTTTSHFNISSVSQGSFSLGMGSLVDGIAGAVPKGP
jgi:hypothetical protein